MAAKAKDYRIWFQSHRLAWGLILIVIFSILRFIETASWRQWFGSSDFQESLPFALFLLFWFIVISIGLIVGGIVRWTGTSWRELGWKSTGLPKAIGMGLLGFVLLYVNVIAWSILKGNAEPPETFVPSLTRLLLAAFFAFGLPAWTEENLFRGYLQPLLAGKMNIWLAVVVQAAIFSAAHLGYSSHLTEFGSAFTAGLILGWLRGRESSLVAPFIAHGLFWMMGAFMVIPT